MKVLQVFNRYKERGGEEKSAQRIFEHASDVCEIEKLWWDSMDWEKPGAPSRLGQLQRLFYNQDSARELKAKIAEFQPDALMCHNIYPVGSPAVYQVAKSLGIPVMQYVHNFRPFSVGGSLWNGNRVAKESLQGNYLSEIWNGSWQDSKARSAIFATLLKGLHASGWLDSVEKWICISEFMRDRFIEAGLPEERVVALRHSWDAKAAPVIGADKGYYLFLSRLVPEKGVNTLLDAWDLLAQKLGRETPILKVGGVGSLAGEVERRVETNSYLEYLGFVDGARKEELISGCRAMLAPSVWWEPLGLVTYESYDASKPMLAAASGGLTETVKDKVTGVLHRPGDAESLMESVVYLEGVSTEKRLSMGVSGRDWLLGQASPEDWKRSFEAILKEVKN